MTVLSIDGFVEIPVKVYSSEKRPLCIHKALPGDSGPYVVSQTSSGGSIVRCSTLKDAREAMRLLFATGIDWSLPPAKIDKNGTGKPPRKVSAIMRQFDVNA